MSRGGGEIRVHEPEVRITCRAAAKAAIILWSLITFVCVLVVGQTENAQRSKSEVLVVHDSQTPGMQSWQSEIVDSILGHDVGQYPSIAVDRDGNFHIAYIDETQRMLRYAYRGRQDKKWFTMALGPGNGVTSIAVDSKGLPHIAYVAPFTGGLRYATYDGKQWHFQLIDPARIEFFTSIALDSNDHPKISYYRRLYDDGSYALQLKYAYFDGQSWFIQTVDSRFGTGKFNSLALDKSGNPYISYSDTDAFALRCAHWDGSRWSYGSPDTAQLNGGPVGFANSIAIDSMGLPHVAYLDPTHRAIKYASRRGASWSIETVDHLVGKGDNIDNLSLKVDDSNRAHLAYYDSGAGVLKYATRTEKGWDVEMVDNRGNAGIFPSLCLTVDGSPYIAYYDSNNLLLRIAHP